MKLTNAFTESGLADDSLDAVVPARRVSICAPCSALAGTVEVAGKAAGNTLKRSTVMIERAAVVNAAQRMVVSQTYEVRPGFLERDAVPDVIAKKARGKTMKIPSFITISDTKVMNEI